MSRIAAYRNTCTSPDGLQRVDIVGLSGLGQPYSGINDKVAMTHLYERQSKVDQFSLAWHEMIPITAIDNMQVECWWPEEDVVCLSVFDFSSKNDLASEKHMVTQIRIERDEKGNWTWK